MSKTSLQKERRQSFSALPQGCELMLDEEHDVQVYRVSTKKWHVRFDWTQAQRDSEERARRQGISMILPKRPTAVVTRWPDHGPDKAAPREFQVLAGGNVTWHDGLAAALEQAREWLVVTDAAKRLRGE